MSLPGADELFRTTGGTALQASSPRRAVPAPAGESDPAAAEGSAEHAVADSEAAEPRARTSPETEKAAPAAAPGQAAAPRRRGGGRTASRRPSGRERHDEKITVYVS
ncbi:hypothetical protein ACFCY4_38480, partial [Streptomyces sp. NPDC056294]